MNITNRNMTGFNAPYISASSTTSKTVNSQLSQVINATVVVNTDLACGSLDATYKGSSVEPSSCNSGVVIFNLENIPSGDSTLLLQGNVECDSNQKLIYGTILLFLTLSILVFGITLFFFKGKLLDKITVKTMIMIFIGFTIGITMVVSSANSIASYCTP